MKRFVSAAALALAAGSALGQTATMPPHVAAFSGATRGYWFTAPTGFRITGIQVLQAANPGVNSFQNWAVVKFDNNTPPPVFATVTNAFTQLGVGFDQPANAYFPVSIDIQAGDVIGIYGNTTTVAAATTGTNSYGNGALGTTILGNPVTLARSGMQFHLGSTTSPQGMHDLWSEPTSTNISRVEFTYTPLTGPSGACCITATGACVISTPTGCTSQGGVYQGDGSQCTGQCPPPPTGACCKFDGSCSLLTQVQCTAQNGVYQGNNTPCGNCPQPSGSVVFALDNRATATTLIGFPLGTPAYNIIGTSMGATRAYAMDFNGTGTVLYAIDNPTNQLGTISTATSAFTPIAVMSGAVEANWGGMSFDNSTGVMYAIGIAAGLNNLYTVNLTTAAATLVAPISGLPAGAILIDIAIDNNGVMIGHEIVTDVMVRIDKTTGVATTLGPTGFAANFAQGMDFDPADNQLYAMLYVGTGVGSFVRVNTTTGACTTITNTQPWTAVGPEMEMAIRGTSGCYANCDNTTNPPCLNVNDFVCFNNAYSVGSPYANCDASTLVPILNVNDFICFNNAYSAGCSNPCAPH
jgi:hypothetical protein